MIVEIMVVGVVQVEEHTYVKGENSQPSYEICLVIAVYHLLQHFMVSRCSGHILMYTSEHTEEKRWSNTFMIVPRLLILVLSCFNSFSQILLILHC